ncbi:MAG: BRO-N domain-containing protein [Stellaceae bacterium]
MFALGELSGKRLLIPAAAARVRMVLLLGVAWFVAADVCRILEIKNPSDAVADLDEDEIKTLSNTEGFIMRGPPSIGISESGLYALILRARAGRAGGRWNRGNGFGGLLGESRGVSRA